MTENEEGGEVSEKCGDTSSVPAAVTDAEKELALRSRRRFEQRNYEASLETLQQLLELRPSDVKVMHNACVARFYLSNCTEIDQFKSSLARACGQAQMNSDENDALDDVDHCVIYYNQAVLLYHERQYLAATHMLDKVFQFIEPVEENLARKVCFLLLELYLCTFQMDKGLCLISYTENSLLGNQTGNNANKSHSPEKEKEKNNSEILTNKDIAEFGSNEACRTKLQQYKARLYIMSKSMRFCKREIKSLMNSTGVNSFTIYLKSNLEYLRGNYRKALKVLNTAPQQQQSVLEAGENMSLMYYNNVGCIHFYLGKANLGYYYFQKALQENDKALKQLCDEYNDEHNMKIPLHASGVSRHQELLFNMGLQLLHAQRPLQAFDCLMEAIQLYTTNPRLWLRLAECCIMVQKKDNSVDFQTTDCHKSMVQGIVGVGIHRKIVLSPGTSMRLNSSEAQSAAMPMPTLEFASLCLKNAILLLQDDGQSQGTLVNSFGSDDADSGSLSASEGGSGHYVSGLPGNPIRGQEVSNIRISILTASSYVSLCLGDIVMALHYAEMLLAQPRLSGIHKLLGHLYAGEALVFLDRISEAIQHFNPDLIKDVSLTLFNNEKEEKEKMSTDLQQENSSLQGWYPNSPSMARTIMQYNLAVAFALRGEHDKASETLRQIGVTCNPNGNVPVQTIMLAMYLQLQQGHTDLTKNIIKQYIPQFR